MASPTHEREERQMSTTAIIVFVILLAASLVLWAVTQGALWFVALVTVASAAVAWYYQFPLWAIIIGSLVIFSVLLALFWQQRSGEFWGITLALGAIVALVAMVLMTSFGGFRSSEATLPLGGLNQVELPSAAPTVTPPPTAPPSPTVTTCPVLYQQVTIGHGTDAKANEKFSEEFADVSVLANDTAFTDEQKDRFIRMIASNDGLLAYYGHAFSLRADPNNVDGLAANNCLTDAGRDLVSQIKGILFGKGTTVVVGDADPNAINTGIDGNTVVTAERPGITVPTKAMIITLPDGSKVTILFYCGNVVWFVTPPGVPTSPKVPQPPVVENPVCPSGTTGTPPKCIEIKIPVNDPAPRKNAGNGDGNNTGLGDFTSVTDTEQPPADSYVAPVAPAPAPTPVGTEPAPQPNPGTTRPIATPEPAAPAPSEALSDCVPAPGKTSCP